MFGRSAAIIVFLGVGAVGCGDDIGSARPDGSSSATDASPVDIPETLPITLLWPGQAVFHAPDGREIGRAMAPTTFPLPVGGAVTVANDSRIVTFLDVPAGATLGPHQAGATAPAEQVKKPRQQLRVTVPPHPHDFMNIATGCRQADGTGEGPDANGTMVFDIDESCIEDDKVEVFASAYYFDEDTLTYRFATIHTKDIAIGPADAPPKAVSVEPWVIGPGTQFDLLNFDNVKTAMLASVSARRGSASIHTAYQGFHEGVLGIHVPPDLGSHWLRSLLLAPKEDAGAAPRPPDDLSPRSVLIEKLATPVANPDTVDVASFLPLPSDISVADDRVAAWRLQPTDVSRITVRFTWFGEDSRFKTWTVWAPPGATRVELPNIEGLPKPRATRSVVVQIDHRSGMNDWSAVLAGWEETILSGLDSVTGKFREEWLVPGRIASSGWRRGNPTPSPPDAGEVDADMPAPLPAFCDLRDAGAPVDTRCDDSERTKTAQEFRLKSASLRIPAGLCPKQGIRVVYVHSNQFDGELAYFFDGVKSTAPAWEALARDTAGANMQIDLGYFERPATILPRLQKALDEVSVLSGHPEIRHAPLTLDGLSGAGTSVVSIGRTIPERTVLVLPYHSFIVDDKEAANVPMLSVLASADQDHANLNISRGLRILRNGGTAWLSAMIQPETRHDTVAANTKDHDFPIAFLRAFVNRRVPEDVRTDCRPVLVPPKPADEWVGVYDAITNEGTPPPPFQRWFFKNPRVMPAKNYTGPAKLTVWLPDEAVARQWLRMHQGAAQ